MKNLFDNAVQQSVISSSAMEKETSLLVHSAMNHIIIGNPMCCGAYAQNAISAIKISHPERFEGVKDYFTFDLRYIDPQVGFCYTDVTVTEDLGHILHRSAFSQHICGKRMADSVYACVPLCWDSNPCSA